MKVIKLLAMLTGVFAMLMGSSSCKKDDSTECCTFTSTDGSGKACEDGTYSYTYNNGETYSGKWNDDTNPPTWDQLKTGIVNNYDGSCS